MAGDGAKWDGLLKWSLAHSDGTRPPRNLSEDDRRWFMEAMQSQTVDVVQRMKEITLVMKTPEDVLESQGITAADIEDLLDELQEHVESIEMANGFHTRYLYNMLLASHLLEMKYLHSIGGLVPLLGYLKNYNAAVRAKAADVVTTIVQNNPRSQKLVMEVSGLDLLLSNFTSDPDITVRTKALGAISSLIRNNKPGIDAFRLADGYAALRDVLASENGRFQRKALDLIQYLLKENNSDCSVITELGFPHLMVHLACSEDSDVREAALGGLLELARDRTSGGNTALAEEDKLRQVLQNRMEGITSMSAVDLGAAREEWQLVESLWNTCYNEPSSLRDKGLVVLPGEEELQHAPDVAGRFLEPQLRAWSGTPAPSKGGMSPNPEKAQPSPLLLGPGRASGSSQSVAPT